MTAETWDDALATSATPQQASITPTNAIINRERARLTTPDPSGGSARGADPGSWNQYAYAGGDPVNRVDPSGESYLDFGFSYLGPGVPWNYCDAICQGQNTWYNIGLYAGAGAQDAVCQALVSAFAGDGGAWNSNCGSVPTQTVANTNCPPQWQAWINAHGSDASSIGLSEANVLALSAYESGWGGGPFAQVGADS